MFHIECKRPHWNDWFIPYDFDNHFELEEKANEFVLATKEIKIWYNDVECKIVEDKQ